MKWLYKFLLYFLSFFTINLIVNALFKPDLDVPTAFSVALGVSLGIVVVERYIDKKSRKE